MSESILGIKNKGVKRLYLWIGVALYTLILPHVIIIYRTIVSNYSSELAGKIPLYILGMLGAIFLFYSARKARWAKTILLYTLSLAIVTVIIVFEPNPNKHIHIIEYILMAWLLFYLFSIDYKGAGIFILIFICASMLGIVDELEQGLHPARYYGLNDMFINSSSVVVGMLSIIGLCDIKESGRFGWFKGFKSAVTPLIVTFFNLGGALVMLDYLFKVQAKRTFSGIYPIWLIVWDVVAIFFSLPYIISYGKGIMQNEDGNITYMLWIFYPLTIMSLMHLIPIISIAFGISFR